MRFIKQWLQAKSTRKAPSDTWIALEQTLHARNFGDLSAQLRQWCRLDERNLTQLLQSARQENYSEQELNKLEILFNYYTNELKLAFDDAQKHIKKYGFDADLHVISVVCLHYNNQFEDAYQYLSNISENEANSIQRGDYWQMVCVILWANNKMDLLEAAVDKAVALAQQDSGVLQAALAMYIELGAEAKIKSVRELLTSASRAQGYAYSLCLLALGEHDEGWRQMEMRYDMEEAHRYINKGLASQPRWTGQSLSGQTLLISAEQGLGDTIQMARYLGLVERHTKAKKVIVEVQPEALTLLQFNFPELDIVERLWAQAPQLPFDQWIGMMSLPLHLQAWGRQTPGRMGYLSVPPENAAYWCERVNGIRVPGVPTIGIAWSGQATHRADRRRSIPFETMMNHAAGAKANFVALQTHVPSNLPRNVLNVSEEMITLADTAALISQMDLVITVDTSIVHLAGALGKAAWLLLPKRYEWRWGLDGEDNDWYDSVKVIRQEKHAQWEPVLQHVFQRLLPNHFIKGI